MDLGVGFCNNLLIVRKPYFKAVVHIGNNAYGTFKSAFYKYNITEL